MPFIKASKTEARLRAAIDGPSGSGKSYTAIRIGCGLSHQRMAVIDTEHGSAHKYADLCDFDIAALTAPYSPERYIALMKEAAKAGYDVIVLDSISHAWVGEGGVLEMVDEATMQSRSRNSYTEGWRKGTPAQNAFVEAMLAYPGHLIATIRTKTEWVPDGKGYRKIGLAPVQRAEIEYEFDLVLSMDLDHVARPSKTRFAALDGRKWSKPGTDFIDELKEALGGTSGGVPPVPSQEAEAVPTNVLASPASASEIDEKALEDAAYDQIMEANRPEPVEEPQPVEQPKTVSAQWMASFEKKRTELGWSNGQCMAYAKEVSMGRTDKPGMLTVIEAQGLGKEIRDALIAGDLEFILQPGPDEWKVGTSIEAEAVAATQKFEADVPTEPEQTGDDRPFSAEETVDRLKDIFQGSEGDLPPAEQQAIIDAQPQIGF